MSKKKKHNAEASENVSEAVTAEEAAAEDISVAAPKKKFNSRKLKYGSIATAITVIVIAAVVLVNVIVNIAADKMNMSIDLTENGTFEISQQSIDYLATVNEPVNIVCLSDEHTFQTATYIYYKHAYEVLKKYTIYSDNITLEFVDMVKDPTYADRYKSIYKGDIDKYSIVIESDKRIKVLAIDDLYNTETQFDYSTFQQYDVPVSSKAEQELTSAIMYVTDPDPLKAVIFNSETVGNSYDNVMNLLVSNGYDVVEMDPLSEPIPEDADIVVINAPVNDYDDAVIDMLYSFLDNNGKLGKNLIYLAGADQKDTKNIDTFLSEWGLQVGEGIVTDNDMNNLYQNLFCVRNYITENDYSGNVPQLSLPVMDFYSRPITLLFDNKDTRSTVPLLQTKETGFVFTSEIQSMLDNQQEFTPDEGVQTTMALGRKYIFDEENKMIFSNVLVIGSSDNLHEQFTSTTYYNNGDYFISVLNTMTGKNTGISIVAKELNSATFDIDMETASNYFNIFIIFIPVAVVIAGVIVFVTRRTK